MDLEDRIVVVATKQDRQLMEQIMRQDGDVSMSAAVRRLIRLEALRRNIQIDDKATANEQYADGAVVAK